MNNKLEIFKKINLSCCLSRNKEMDILLSRLLINISTHWRNQLNELDNFVGKQY